MFSAVLLLSRGAPDRVTVLFEQSAPSMNTICDTRYNIWCSVQGGGEEIKLGGNHVWRLNLGCVDEHLLLDLGGVPTLGLWSQWVPNHLASNLGVIHRDANCGPSPHPSLQPVNLLEKPGEQSERQVLLTGCLKFSWISYSHHKAHVKLLHFQRWTCELC